MNEDLVLELDTGQDVDLLLDSGTDIEIDADIGIIKSTDYNQLVHKPQINGVELYGDKLLSAFLYDGIIIDGGDAGTGASE